MSMRSSARRRRYLPAGPFIVCRPLLEYNEVRDAYVLRAIGERLGPVVRPDRRQVRVPGYPGPERRGVARQPPESGSGRWALPH